jgi:glucosylglycerate synthase
MPESAATEIGEADVVVGLVPPPRDGDALESAIARIVSVSLPMRAVLVHPPYAATASDPTANTEWQIVTSQQVGQNPANTVQTLEDSFRAIADMARRVGARACGLIASDLSVVTPRWIHLLIEPALSQSFDLIAPCYARHPFEGMINRAIVYPLFRALYGKQVRNPMGPDFGISAKLLERATGGSRPRAHPLLSLATEAATSGMKICQSHLGPRAYSPPDWTALSSLLALVLGPLFTDVERYASNWQRARGSLPIPEFGDPLFVSGPETPIDVTRLIDSFRLGARNLQEVWGMILPPSTLVELLGLSRRDGGAFSMPDETWARIVYDFALAYRVRTISREQILRSITPIYLGWLASYANGLGSLDSEAVERRLEKLCLAYEDTKPYFVARWRWPDRFNP